MPCQIYRHRSASSEHLEDVGLGGSSAAMRQNHMSITSGKEHSHDLTRLSSAKHNDETPRRDTTKRYYEKILRGNTTKRRHEKICRFNGMTTACSINLLYAEYILPLHPTHQSTPMNSRLCSAPEPSGRADTHSSAPMILPSDSNWYDRHHLGSRAQISIFHLAAPWPNHTVPRDRSMRSS